MIQLPYNGEKMGDVAPNGEHFTQYGIDFAKASKLEECKARVFQVAEEALKKYFIVLPKGRFVNQVYRVSDKRFDILAA